MSATEEKAHAFSRLEGARQFVRVWLNLGHEDEPIKETAFRPLNPV
jgi:hypothetical protein